MNEEYNPESKPDFEVKITADNLSVYVRVYDDGISKEEIIVSDADIISLIEKRGVKYGILRDEISEFCNRQNYFQWHKVAFGTRATDGEDGSFALTFDSSHIGPKQREDGSVDYRELGLIKNVYEGEVLCNIVLPKAGLDGTNVFGGAIPAKQGKPAAVEPGNNVVITDDKTELRAGTDGCVYFKGGKVYIEEAYSVKSDVCLKTGNIQFNGSVHIAESVRQGFKVTAQKDIYVKGLVEGAELSAGGNIAIVGGITGMNTAKIEAGGDITVKFIENAHVECGGNITCDIILMSDVKAEKSIVMKGERAAIIGGRVLAGETITAKALGSNKHPKQEVSVRRNWNVEGDNAEKEQMKDREKKAALKKKLAAAEKMVEEYSARIKAENALGPKKSIAAMKECMVKKSEFAAVAASLKNMIENYIEHDFVSSISCTGFVYPGVRIRIDHCQMDVTTPLQNQKFYVSEGEIVAGTVLPGERNA